MELKEMFRDFLCRWWRRWGLMTFVWTDRALVADSSFLHLCHFCAQWWPWFCAFRYYLRTRLWLSSLSRNGLLDKARFPLFLSSFAAYFPRYCVRVVVVRTRCRRLRDWTSRSWDLLAFGITLLSLDLDGSNTASGLQLDISLKWPEQRFFRLSDLRTRRDLPYGFCWSICLTQRTLLHQLFLWGEESTSSVNVDFPFPFYQSRGRRRTRQFEVKLEGRECLHQLTHLLHF